MHGSDEAVHYVMKSRGGIKYEKYEIIEGLANSIERKFLESSSEFARKFYAKYMSDIICDQCRGMRVNKFARAVLIAKKNIFQITQLPINETLN
jgi:excinuclease ABC subunit A